MLDYVSKLRLCSSKNYYNGISSFRDLRIDAPWSAEKIVKGKGAHTESIYDCISPLIADPGVDVVMMHICPSEDNFKKFNTAKKLILEKIEKGNEDLHAMLFGGTNSLDSKKIANLFEEFFNTENISYSKVLRHKTSDNKGSDLAYRAVADEFMLHNKAISNQITDNRLRFLNMSKEELRENLLKILQDNFEEVNVEKLDLIV